ncbi:MAG: AAA family ATPase [Acidimicrobiia bacterium]|nr:AAA family ATPase [Acidimicrobiia bacterium]MDH3398849.1 AAA family ATPase [Acidimicrobiia bacterium]MDH5615238.1 AAA family ATPase [Acidimicrobiia bacterium]
MTRVFAVANQKGGVAKTTTVQSLGSAFAELGRKVLLIDLDPQACLTYSMGVDSEGLERSIHDVMLDRTTAAKAIVEVGDLHLLPSSIDLTGAEIHLLTKTGREYVLSKALRPVLSTYDLVMIDCPPSLGILTINGLTAVREVLIPLQPETLSHRGVGQLLETIEDVRTYTNSKLKVLGAVATMFDARTRLAREIVEDLPHRYGITVLDPPIPKTVRVAEAPARGMSVLEYAGRSKASEAYRALAQTLEEM